MSVFSPKPSPQQGFHQSPRLSERKEGYQVGIFSSTTGGRSRVSVVNSVPGTLPTTGGASSFDGSNNGLSITDAAQTGLDTGNGFTAELWLRGTLDATSTKQFCVLSKLDANGGYEINVRNIIGVSQIETIFRKDSSTVGSAAVTFGGAEYNSRVFHHYVMTYNQGTAITYLNAVAVGTSTTMPSTIGDSASAFFIGRNTSGTTRLPGIFSEVKIWNRAKTAAEVLLDMRNDSPSGGGLVGYWPLGTDTQDYSGNGNHLTVGTASFGTVVPFSDYGQTQRFYCSAGDGHCTNGSITSSFANVRNAANSSGVSGTHGTAQVLTDIQRFPPTDVITINRISLPFNTSTLTPTLIRGAHVFLKPSATNDGNVGLVAGTPASATALGTADYSKFAATDLATRKGAGAANDFTGTVYGYFEMNSVSPINPGGHTFLGLRMERDIDNNPSAGDNVNGMTIFTSEGAANRQPFLDVVI